MTRIKVSFGKPVFIHNKMNTVCKLRYQIDVPYYFFRGEVTTVSKYSPGDKYDERTGERVALARAEVKARGIVKDKMNRFLKKEKNLLKDINEFIKDIDKFNSRDREAIKRFLGDSE